MMWSSERYCCPRIQQRNKGCKSCNNDINNVVYFVYDTTLHTYSDWRNVHVCARSWYINVEQSGNVTAAGFRAQQQQHSSRRSSSSSLRQNKSNQLLQSVGWGCAHSLSLSLSVDWIDVHVSNLAQKYPKTNQTCTMIPHNIIHIYCYIIILQSIIFQARREYLVVLVVRKRSCVFRFGRFHMMSNLLVIYICTYTYYHTYVLVHTYTYDMTHLVHYLVRRMHNFICMHHRNIGALTAVGFWFASKKGQMM